MKTKGMWVWLAVLVLMLGPGVAQADLIELFPNGTLVQSWKGSKPVEYNGGYWSDVIGNTEVFDSFGAAMNRTTGRLTIYTNWGGPDSGTSDTYDVGVAPYYIYGAGSFWAYTADLFLDTDVYPGYDTAIRLRNNENQMGNVYQVSDYYTSRDKFGGSGWIYGGGMNQKNNPQDEGDPIPVEVEDGKKIGTTDVTWKTQKGGFPTPWGGFAKWKIEVNLNGIVEPEQFAFLWATGTCANDLVMGAAGSGLLVPVPGAALLLGAGLCRLGAYLRRRRAA